MRCNIRRKIDLITREWDESSTRKMSTQARNNLSDNLISTDYLDASESDGGSPIVTDFSQFSTITSIINNVTAPVIPQSSQNDLLESLIIPLYGTIFFLSIVGNSLVLITLARNKRMRTVTNVYLLNLVSPFTLFLLPFYVLLHSYATLCFVTRKFEKAHYNQKHRQVMLLVKYHYAALNLSLFHKGYN